MSTKNGFERIFKLALAVYRLAEMVSREDGPLDVFSSTRRWAETQRVLRKEYGRMTSPKGHEIIKVKVKDGYRRWDSFYRLIHCPLCLGVWFALLMAIVPVPDTIVDWLAVAGLHHLIASAAAGRRTT